MKFVSIPIFILSLAIGLFVVYISMPPTQIIYVYPNPDNEDKILYKDKADNCFKFQKYEIDCPKNASEIEEYKVQ